MDESALVVAWNAAAQALPSGRFLCGVVYHGPHIGWVAFACDASGQTIGPEGTGVDAFAALRALVRNMSRDASPNDMESMGRGWPPGSEWLETGVPELVRHGVPEDVVRRWTISDDSERSDAIAAASDDELQEMIEGTNRAADALVAIIHTDRTDAAAVLAGLLTDAEQEAELELAQRHRRRRGAGDIPGR